MAKIQFDTQFKTPYITSYGEKQQKKNRMPLNLRQNMMKSLRLLIKKQNRF